MSDAAANSTTALALRHGRALVFIALFAAAAGLFVWGRLPKGIYPEVTFLRVQVAATLPGAPAATVLAGITRPLEAALAAVPGVERVKSRTIRAAAELSLFFAQDTDMLQAHQLVLARLAETRTTLPPDAEVVAERVTPSSFPILSMNIEGPYAPTKLYEIAQYTLRPALSGLPGVGLVGVQSSDVPEMEVLLDSARLEAAHLTVTKVADRLRDANQVRAVARLTDTHEQALGVVTGELGDATAISDVVIGGTPEAPLRVRDVGRVVEDVAPRTTLIRVDGRPGVILNVARRPGGDALELANAVREKLAALKSVLPPGVSIVPVYDQAVFVNDGIQNVRDAVLLGAILAVLVLALFLRDLRATMLAATSLPLTLGATLLALHGLGQTMNLMSLGGLAVAVGLVIDDAVVIIEAIHRHLEAGLSPTEAARRGTAELFWPVVGTTATTIVVFLPLGLLSGVAGQFFMALSIALAAAVAISLPVALLILPALCAPFLRPPRHRSAGASLAHVYARLLDRALNRPRIVALGALLLALGGALIASRLPTDFLPEADEGSYVLDYFAPVGASQEDADALATRVEAIVRDTPEVESFSRRLGAELGPPVATLPSRGDIAVRLKRDRKRAIDEILDDQRARISAAVPGLRVEFVQVLADMLGDLQGSPEPVEVKVFGSDPKVLQPIAAQIAARLDHVPGLVDLFTGDEGCAPEVDLRIDALAGGRQGLTAAQVSEQLSADFLGVVPTSLRRPDHLENVRVRLAPSSDEQPGRATLESARLLTESGAGLPVQSVTRLETACPKAALLRENQQNMVHVTARLSGTDLGTAVATVRARLANLPLPPGVHWELGGLAEQQAQSFRSLLVALAVAIAAVAGVLLFQLRSVRRSLAVLAGAPLGLAGGCGALWATHIALNVSSMMGGILLIGLMVKNGILLLDCALLAEENGTPPRQALLEAARLRLRPILMTTLATLAGLFPLALGLGAGAALQQPLAIMVIGGLLFSTAATLFVVPALALWVRRN